MKTIEELKAQQQQELEQLQLEHNLARELGEIPGLKISSFLGGLKTYGYYHAACDVTKDVRSAFEYAKERALLVREYVGRRGGMRSYTFHPGLPDLSEEPRGIQATSFPFTEEHATGKTGHFVLRFNTISYGTARPNWEVKFFLDQPRPMSVNFRIGSTKRSRDLMPRPRYEQDRIIGWLAGGPSHIPQYPYVHEGKQTAEVTILLTLEEFESYFLTEES